ncbi:MAG: hypothetical protein FWC20_01775 [Oscillospiraceae bacterium]|nr:hypothetical protein [Oscillospiraceae bacterium]MCL2278123.1 hypothetical protein [Oscillospiraceae bacterium]
MKFSEFKKVFQDNFESLTKEVTQLFEIEIDKEEFWNLYLDSFPPGTNEVYRERREFDCSCCRHFVKSFGNAVVIKNNEVHTLWDFETGDGTFQPVVNALSQYLKSKPVVDIFVNKHKGVGTNQNYEQAEDGKSVKWEHFYVLLPDRLVDHDTRSIGDLKGASRDIRNVFKRSLDEITEESVLSLKEVG